MSRPPQSVPARPRVLMLGLRGFPGVQGGVETHAENLCPHLVDQGWDVEVITRKPYHPPAVGREWRGVRLTPVWSPRKNGLEPMIHSALAVLRAAVTRPDIVHIQAIGPAFVTPLARLLGLKVVVTHHGPDYDRQKWGGFARLVLRLGERFGMRWSQAQIVISRTIFELVRAKHGVEATIIPNGVVAPDIPASHGCLDELGLAPRRYVLLVSRLVPEKRHLDLMQAFLAADMPGWKLVLAGAADHESSYVNEVRALAAQSDRIVMAGFRTGLALRELYAHAGVFVLPSSHEGLPIALLEALSYGLPSLASAIPANLEVGLAKEAYFQLGNRDELARKLTLAASTGRVEGSVSTQQVLDRYDWRKVAASTADVYRRLLSGRR